MNTPIIPFSESKIAEAMNAFEEKYDMGSGKFFMLWNDGKLPKEISFDDQMEWIELIKASGDLHQERDD